MSDTDEIKLEAVADAEPSVELGDSILFGDESIAGTGAKLGVVEALLRLVPRDIKFPDFVREALLAVMRAVKCEAGSVLEINQAEQSLFFRAVVGQSSDQLSKFVIPMGQGIVGHVVESKQPIVVANVPENRIHLKSIQDAVGFEARNMVAFPLLVRGKVYGVLELLNRVGENNFTAGDVDLLNYLCEMVSRAIEIRMMLNWASRPAQTPKKEAA